jgi:hypothetical protein
MSLKPIPLDANTAALAKRLVWFDPPEKTLAYPARFLAYAFALARSQEMKVIRRYVDDASLREALRSAPPGIIDARSWAYWHVMLDMGEAPPLPTRHLI